MKRYSGHILFLMLICTIACSRKADDMVGPTIGKINIIADESMRVIAQQEEEIFERFYPYTDISITYMNEFDLMERFLADSIRVIMTTRALTPEEVDFCKARKAFPRQTAFATGAIAFIAHPETPDTTYTYESLLNMLNDPASGKQFVIENIKSGITQDILDRINRQDFPSHFYTLPAKQEVLDYVRQHIHAIGIIDYSDISDSDSAFTREVLASIQLLGISRPIDSIQHGFVKPYQYNLQDWKYPFTRDLHIISTTGKSDVSTGFASFIAGEIGQKIILKAGLLPKFQTERIIEFNHIPDIKVVQ